MIPRKTLEELAQQLISPPGPPVKDMGNGEMSFTLPEPTLNPTGTYDGSCGYDKVCNQDDPVHTPLNQLIALKHRFDELVRDIIGQKENQPEYDMSGVEDCLPELQNGIDKLQSQWGNGSCMGVDLNDGMSQKAIIFIPLSQG